MKKLLISLLAALMIVGLVGCGKKNSDTNSTTAAGSGENVTTDNTNTNADTNTDTNENTLGNKLASIFLSEIAESTDLEAIAEKLSETTDLGCMVIEANEGYLNGFSEEIKGFKTGVQFSPMIGSIPFVGYIFEVDDAESFKKSLLAVADPRWNICTEAAETVCVTSGNYVFFTMCPSAEELEQ